MSKPVIQFEAVSKKYRQRRGRSFRDFFLQLGQLGQAKIHPPFWALKDVSFKIEPGETVGLIGANGAGKSTVLKLISDVSEASSGKVKVNGRVGALLELGAGFHPELSGRDNIYLNAALLGMSRREIQRKFDAIVDFSELEDFIDTPVKHFSSGMFMRLAFAVNIHVEPEILLVDEVLAVGDYRFQNKCLGQISLMRQKGVSIVLVSHSTDAVLSHCARAIWLDKGSLVADGFTDVVVRQYTDRIFKQEADELIKNRGATSPGIKRWGSGAIKITRVRLTDETGTEQAIFETQRPFVIEIYYQAVQAISSPIFGLALHRLDGLHVCGPNTGSSGLLLPTLLGEGCVRYNVSHLPLLDGLYRVSVASVSSDYTETYDYHDQAYPFRVVHSTHKTQDHYGMMTLGGNWQLVTGREFA